MISILGQLLWWMVEHWAPLLAVIGLLMIFAFLKMVDERLGDILIALGAVLTALRAIDKDIGHINEEVEKNTAALGSVHDAVSGVDETLSDCSRCLSRIEDELSPRPPPYLTPTGDRL
jgi:hypothetical protein